MMLDQAGPSAAIAHYHAINPCAGTGKGIEILTILKAPAKRFADYFNKLELP